MQEHNRNNNSDEYSNCINMHTERPVLAGLVSFKDRVKAFHQDIVTIIPLYQLYWFQTRVKHNPSIPFSVKVNNSSEVTYSITYTTYRNQIDTLSTPSKGEERIAVQYNGLSHG